MEQDSTTQGGPGMGASSPEAMDWLSGGGEMGKLIRAMDWSRTPLGPVEAWPQSLRTTVSLCLSSTFPILIAWGPERVQIYNDSYRPICGAKHPESMGQPFRVCWATALPMVGGAFDKAGAGTGSYIENQRMLLDRYGYLEEAFMTFSFSPIRDESGSVGGLFHPITEVTEKMLSARRTQTLRELAALLGKVKTVEAIGAALPQLPPDAALDVPFLLFYRRDEARDGVRLVNAMGLPPGSAWSPEEAALDGPWPFAASTTAEPRTVDVPRAPLEGVTCGPYEDPPVHARVLPLIPAGMTEPFGYLVAGVSPRRALDDAYRSFYEQLQSTLTTAVVNVRTYEAEAQRAEALAAIDRAKTAFFSNVSHEFRTPLTLILGPLEESLADTSFPLPPAQRARQELTHRNALRLLKLVNSLLDFSRIEAGRVKASFHPTDLGQLTEDLTSVFRSAMEKAGLTYTVEVADVGEPVYVDRDMWEKVVLNLLSNAFKFTLQGGVTVRLSREGDRVRLAVRDTGTGIPEAELPRVFERFHRVETSRGRTHEGTGIGLALIQELVKLHGGTLGVESVEEEGSTFFVELPLGSAHLPQEHVHQARGEAHAGKLGSAFSEEALRWLPDAPDAIPPSVPEQAPRVEPTTALGHQGAGLVLPPGRGRILVADDNADMRAYVSSLLAPQWEVRTVADGEAAFEAALRDRPDLILSDVMMPRLDGFGLLRKLRDDVRTRGIPFVLLSARAGEEARIEGLQAGADDYLVKPFSARELQARVDSQLQLGRARQQLSDFFMQAPTAMCVMTGPELVFTVINPMFADLMGRDMLGKRARDAQPEGGHGVLLQCLEGVFHTGQPFVGREVPVRQPDGRGGLKELLADVDIHPQRDSEGHILGLLVAVQEVSEQVRARQRLEALTQDLRNALTSRDTFLGVASHELKTPVTALLLHLEVTRRRLSSQRAEPPTPEKLKVAMDTALRQVERLARLVDELLDVSRIQAGKLDFHLEESDPVELVREVLESFHEQLHQARCAVELRVESGARVWWDRSRMEQVLVNLVSNAIKYAPGQPIRIEVTRHDGQLSIRVADSGPGIPREHQARVFERFERGGPPRSVHGLGLGLFIASQIVQGHHGQLRLDSDAGRGATFTIELPLKPHAQA
ncbi:response regulator [Corallococcus sp. ZKHCc1 1396]|uniref:histidine kinase n=2 Tax=Corallococcus soli TaxID=2710757 RepID=A0ABR9PR05_9BACT|nr:ATP-binding protein [Corallococcus soli]MBE4750365.1 response regulator [Corallococcus soli]